jgi:ubiquinone/menaquinone biosynthesis C-methylase UbiE
MLGERRATLRHGFTALTDLLASPYDLGFSVYNWGFRVLGGRRHSEFRRSVIELAGLRGEETILDAGCGTGLTLLGTAQRCPGCRLCGLDLSARMVEVASSEARECGLPLSLGTGTILRLPYRDGAFDVVLTNIMFHHLDIGEKRQAVAEVARVLRPGGRYVSAEFGPRASNPLERRLAKGDYTLYPSHLKECGLRIVSEELRPLLWGLDVVHRVAVKTEPAKQ